MVIVDEFHHGDMFDPCFRVGTAEDVKIGLHLLIESFGFSINLGVVSGG